MTITEHMPQVSTGAVIGVIVLLGVAGGGGYWMGQATAERPPADSTDIGRKGGKGDLADASDPDEVTTYERDTTDTRTQCFEAPSWMISHRSPSVSPEASPNRAGDSSTRDSTPDTSARRSDASGGPTYAITPLTSGSPSVSVGRNEVEFSALLPAQGGTRMRTWTYDIDRPDNRLSAFAEAGTLPLGAYALTGGQYTRDLGRVDIWGLTLDTQVHAAGAQAWTTQGAGSALRTGLSIGITW
jgi:hypothetical protein